VVLLPLHKLNQLIGEFLTSICSMTR
jgi:hypothetical protein